MPPPPPGVGRGCEKAGAEFSIFSHLTCSLFISSLFMASAVVWKQPTGLIRKDQGAVAGWGQLSTKAGWEGRLRLYAS